jgi:hypothetical protein
MTHNVTHDGAHALWAIIYLAAFTPSFRLCRFRFWHPPVSAVFMEALSSSHDECSEDHHVLNLVRQPERTTNLNASQ